MFQERIKSGKQIYLHEFLYPVFQAYDAVSMDVDMQIGGNDQTFNMLAGRTFMRKMKNKEKFVIATKLLTDSSGKKMGKTEGNTVNLDEKPGEMFGKIMSWPDGFILPAFELCTNIPMDKIKELKQFLQVKENNPRDIKLQLAEEIVKIYHGDKKAQSAKQAFVSQFSKGELPSDIPVKSFAMSMAVSGTLVAVGLATSKSEAKRLLEQGGVKIDGKVQNQDIELEFSDSPILIQVGKRKFVRVKRK